MYIFFFSYFLISVEHNNSFYWHLHLTYYGLQRSHFCTPDDYLFFRCCDSLNSPINITDILLSDRQTTEMDKVMHELGNTLSDQDVNAVASQQFDAQQVADETKVADLPQTVCGHALNMYRFVVNERCWRTSGPVSWSK